MAILDVGAQLRLKASGLSDVGLVRQDNEDAFLCDPELGLFAVADGMGGHRGGKVAAQMAIEGLRLALAEGPPVGYLADPSIANRRQLFAFLTNTVNALSAEIHARGRQQAELRGMGCTLDVVLVRGHGVFLVHVGDSRVYGLLGGTLYQLTEDHTLSQELLRSGAITADEERVHPNRHDLVRALGVYPKVEVDTIYLDVTAGDSFLLCSDGVHGLVDNSLLAEALTVRPEQATQRIISLALQNGGRDNATAVVFNVEESAAPQPILVGSQETRQAMARASTFAEFTEGELLRIQKIATGRVVEADEFVFRQGELGADLFLLLEGTLSASVDGKRMGSLGPGETFGELSLFPGPNLGTIQAESRSRMLVFPLGEIQHLLRSDTALAAKLAMNCLKRVWKGFHDVAHGWAEAHKGP